MQNYYTDGASKGGNNHAATTQRITTVRLGIFSLIGLSVMLSRSN